MTPPPGTYCMRCVHCGDVIAGVWYASPLLGECRDCRLWWEYLRQTKERA